MKKIVLTLLCSLLCAAAFAQSAALISLAQAELQKRGLSETEVRVRLLEEGINVDTIPTTEYAQYQPRIIAILDQMQEEKGVALATAGENNTVTSPEDAPVTTSGEAIAEATLERELKENGVSPTEGDYIYGHSLFTGKSSEVFRTTDGAQAPETYVLGEGDEVHISIFGSSQTEIHQRIAADGSIQPVGSSKIFLKGLTLAQGRKAIKTRLAQHYSFREDQIAVTLSTARTLTVSIYGEVGVQGGFTLSALNTAFNALAAAGGPTRMGSIRNIQRSRGGKVTRLDLYKFMTGSESGAEYDLQNNDILFVPIADKIVRIEGAVNRPMSYEMVDGETLLDLLTYAGGLKNEAYPNYVQIERFSNGEKVLLEYNLSQITTGTRSVVLEAGDIVRIKDINKPMENYVVISGDVFYPGQFNYDNNRSLLKLLEAAQPRRTVRKEYVLVERTRPDETVEVLSVPYPGEKGNPDFILQPRDRVTVLQLSDFRDVATITVTGQVRDPFTREFGVNDRMSISQAIELAGGLKPSVYPVAYIFRRDLTNTDKMSYIRVSLENDGDQMLQPGDALHIYDNSTYTHIGEVRISGAVNNSFATTYDPSLTIHDLVTMAGGYDANAALDHVEVFRLNLSEKVAKLDCIPIELDENYNAVDASFQLEPYDHIVVRRIPNVGLDRVVEINGRVLYPGVYVLTDSRTQLSEVIKMAGGTMDDASPYGRVFRTYKNRGSIGVNLKDAQKHKNSEKYDPILMSGDVINIDREENTVIIREHGTRMSQYVPEDFALDHKLLVYQGPKSAKWYINHCAGGFQKYADKNSVTVTMPNNQSEGVRHFLFFRIYPKVQPGSVITLTMDHERKQKAEEPKEKIHWEQVAASSLSALTSIVSMILLVERLN
ncbi:MAG: SLBB domain-containing protein [Bacteroidales bacterium]|nr:SLBB domain-containing protein [Bacteroidales bacterium]